MSHKDSMCSIMRRRIEINRYQSGCRHLLNRTFHQEILKDTRDVDITGFVTYLDVQYIYAVGLSPMHYTEWNVNGKPDLIISSLSCGHIYACYKMQKNGIKLKHKEYLFRIYNRSKQSTHFET